MNPPEDQKKIILVVSIDLVGRDPPSSAPAGRPGEVESSYQTCRCCVRLARKGNPGRNLILALNL